MVSRSFGVQEPFTASVSIRTEAEAEAIFPASTFCRSMALKLPSPPSETTASIMPNWSASLSSNTELPPLLNDCILISSALKSVGFNTTRTPLLNVRTVVPKAPCSVFTTLPGCGSSAISGSLETLSTYGSSFSFLISPSHCLISASVGYFISGLSGQNRLITMLLSLTSPWNT